MIYTVLKIIMKNMESQPNLQNDIYSAEEEKRKNLKKVFHSYSRSNPRSSSNLTGAHLTIVLYRSEYTFASGGRYF